MKKWEQIEEKLNDKILNSLDSIESIAKNTTPEKIKKFVHDSNEKLTTKSKVIAEKSIHSVKNIKETTSKAKERVTEASSKTKTLINTSVQKAKETDWKTVNYIDKALFILEWLFYPIYKKATAAAAKAQPTTIAAWVVVGTVGSITFIGVYKNTKKIAEETAKAREPAAIVDKATAVSKRPHYYKQQEKELRIRNVYVPVYIESSTSYRKLEIDLTMVSSNKYIKQYFYDNNYLIQDMLNSKVEPVVPSFPLEQEGKDIVTHKIKEEVNKLLKKYKIKGEIKYIYIHSIMAG